MNNPVYVFGFTRKLQGRECRVFGRKKQGAAQALSNLLQMKGHR
jgi:hypothetical protein